VHGKPGVDGGLDSMPRAIVGNRLKVWEVDATIGDLGTTHVDVFFSNAALPDAVTFLVAEGTSIGTLGRLEEGVRAVTLLS